MSPPPTLLPRRFTLIVVWLALFADYILMTIVIPIFPVLKESEVRTGMMFSAKAAVQIFSAPLVATIVDDLGLCPLMLGLAVEVVSTLVFAFTQDYTIWFSARACQGIASACILSSGFLHVQRAYKDDPLAMGAAMGTVTTGIISGVVLGPPLGGILYGLSPPLPFLLLASLLATVLVMTCVLSYMVNSATNIPTDDTLLSNAAGKRGSTRGKALALLSDSQITAVLGALFAANAAISCLEATIGMYATRTLGLDTSDVGFLFMVTAIPSVIGAKLAGTLGALAEGKKRWRVAFGGVLIQGGFFAAQAVAIPRVSVVTVEVCCMLGLGLGMGLVDGSCPAMLAERSEARHGSTGVVYTLSTAATQLGFLIGPVGGSVVMARSGFAAMCLMLGVVMWLYSPLLPRIFHRRNDDAATSDRKGIYSDTGGEDEERVDLLRESGGEHERSGSAKKINDPGK